MLVLPLVVLPAYEVHQSQRALIRNLPSVKTFVRRAMRLRLRFAVVSKLAVTLVLTIQNAIATN